MDFEVKKVNFWSKFVKILVLFVNQVEMFSF